MIPVEFLWGMLILVFGVIGLARGLWRELGVTTILLLSLFALNLGEKLILEKFSDKLQVGPLANAPSGSITALYYGASMLFVAFVAYQGVSLEFPIKKQKGPLKWFLGYLGGLLNGYLLVGALWDVINQAGYFGLKVPLGTTGSQAEISSYLTEWHAVIIKYLPVMLMNTYEPVAYIVLAFGMILLLAIVLK